MKNKYLALLTVLFLTSCGEQKEISLDAVLASNDLKQIKSKEVRN